jgi:hypothetical protein
MGFRDQARLQVVRLGNVVLAFLPLGFPSEAYRAVVDDLPPAPASLWVTAPANGYQGDAGGRTDEASIPWCGTRDQAPFVAFLRGLMPVPDKGRDAGE